MLTPGALAFVSALQREFGPRRKELLEARARRRARLAAARCSTSWTSTRKIRESDWQVAPVPEDMQQRWVEITGPTDRKLVINALNSGADGFMADFEDANAPTWRNMVEGHINLRDAIDGTINYRALRRPRLRAARTTRRRCWCARADGICPSATCWSTESRCRARCSTSACTSFTALGACWPTAAGPYFYLPKMESHLEARLWNDVFCFAQDELGVPRGTIKATVLIETLPAAFEMDEILYELRDHSAGLNAGRWDYIFSSIKCFPDRPEMVLPDRGDVTMTVPFMRAYTELLAATCHRRGAHAMGGMAALIPSRKDEEANEKALAGVRADKEREVGQGYDGTWVAHPDLVPTAREVFEQGLNGAAQPARATAHDVHVISQQLLDLASTPGEITEAGLRTDVNVGFQYVSFWLSGRGAAAINSLMEDAATAEISRSQIWQWVHHGAQLEDGRTVTAELVREVLDEETAEDPRGGRRRDLAGRASGRDPRDLRARPRCRPSCSSS